MEKTNNKIKIELSGIKKFFHDLFNDENNINEKSVIGFASFCIMVIFALADIITGALGKDLVVNEFIFNSFLIMTLGALGIGSVDKYINKKSNTSSEE
jgi:hypothetical protein